ncbi:PREDICTED: lysM domain receptor-like kinase 3 [Tarenaya hassleriana]|uniref:lysM domain receptor-like kinase 3 n=1 Tax=Tarenaya hassleriana TaxID=28532 RepID=UPI00053C2951|nr:PREDICTED: lysM domain receptor-like kinase 3 [Tarenaya hassleriana]
MCKTKMATNVSEPTRARPRRYSAPPTPPPRTRSEFMSTTALSSLFTATGASTSSGTSSSVASRTSLASLRDSLPDNPHIYDVEEIRVATNSFLGRRLPSSSSTASWRCNLRGKEAVVFQRKFRRRIAMFELRDWLSVICRSHHRSIINLLGASVSDGGGGGDHVYLVYKYVHGATLADCLRNPRNPNFTVLSSWISRIRIAADLAHGLDYIHNKTGLKIRNLVHNHINSSAVIVTEPDLNAKICHFGTAQLRGETDEVSSDRDEPQKLKRSDSNALRFEGVRGYMSPEFQATGIATQKSDVYAFGVTMLELLSGEEPLRYKFDKSAGNFERTSVIETAAMAAAIDSGEGEREGRLRRWMDQRLRDSFPVTVVEELMKLALECVEDESEKRPEMGRVAGKISKLYLESEKWSERMQPPVDFTVSMAPR